MKILKQDVYMITYTYVLYIFVSKVLTNIIIL